MVVWLSMPYQVWLLPLPARVVIPPGTMAAPTIATRAAAAGQVNEATMANEATVGSKAMAAGIPGEISKTTATRVVAPRIRVENSGTTQPVADNGTTPMVAVPPEGNSPRNSWNPCRVRILAVAAPMSLSPPSTPASRKAEMRPETFITSVPSHNATGNRAEIRWADSRTPNAAPVALQSHPGRMPAS